MPQISSQQLTANRINSKKGGVKTEKGKAISKYNSIKHGLLSKEVLMKSEKEDEFIEFSKHITTSLKPINEIERLLVDRIITNSWRLKRVIKIEKEMTINNCETRNFLGKLKKSNIGKAFSIDFNNNSTYWKLTKYEANIEKGIYKAIHELQRIQSQRTGSIFPPVMTIDL